MDNLTHSLIGLAASKAGLERLSPATTAVCLIAANAPDADIFTLLLGGRWVYLHYHRGITHSILGTLVLAVTIPLLFFLADLAIAHIRRRTPTVKLRTLTLASLIVSATHPLMDWTNNYGIRPLLPWNSRWFYGDIVFIVDPLIWLMIGGAAFLLTSKSRKQIALWTVLALILTYIVTFAAFARPGIAIPGWIRGFWIAALIVLIILSRLGVAQRWGERIALAGFAMLLMYWGSLALLHSYALRNSQREAGIIAQSYGENVVDVAAMPTLANPFHWQTVVETERAAYRFELSLIGNKGRSNLVRHERPETAISAGVSRALTDQRAKIFLEFARFPVVRVLGADCTTQTLVQLADLRYTEPGSQRGTFTLEVPVECQSQR